MGQPNPTLRIQLKSCVQSPAWKSALAAFRTQVSRHWFKALRRRSQRTRLNWNRMDRLITKWLPPARVRHPFPDARFDARIQGRSPVR